MPTPDPTDSNSQPALVTGGAAALIAAAVLLVVTRLNRSIDIFNLAELDNFKTILTVGTPLVSAWLIKRKVVPLAKHEAVIAKATSDVKLATAIGYAQAVEDKDAAPVPDHVVEGIRAQVADQHAAEALAADAQLAKTRAQLRDARRKLRTRAA